VAVLKCGVGPVKAERRTRVALERVLPGQVWSLGTCGSVADDPVGTVVTADAVHWHGWRDVVPLPGLKTARVATVRAPVMDVGERDKWARQGATVVEMEAGAVLAAAGQGFRALKVVSDLAGAVAAGAGAAGAGDPVLASHDAASFARFQVLAGQLVSDALVPQLVRALQV
jgi:nucleoside phosphorylase